MKKILVAEDDASIRRIVEIALAEEGMEVIPASDGEEAFQKALKEQPDAILLDIMMPKMNGLEVCAKLKANQITAEIPIGFLTAQKEFSSYEQAQELGGLLYVTKPFEPKRLELVSKMVLWQREEKKEGCEEKRLRETEEDLAI
jgi:two-component system alkaline phosphatase synthesis response regulator PhoP